MNQTADIRDMAVADIRQDPSLQPRCDGLIEAHVLNLMETPESLQPITVVVAPQGAVIVDGNHTLAAATRLGFTTIRVRVIPMPADGDLFRLAFDRNLAHGLRLTRKDRSAYAARLIAQQPVLSDREIGRRTGLNHETVGALRRGAPSQFRSADRKPGELDSDIGLFDPIRRAKAASRPQKAVAGYIKRFAAAAADPYDDDGYTIDGRSEDPLEIARACFLAMGPGRASELLSTLETDVRFIAQVARARKDPSLRSLGDQK